MKKLLILLVVLGLFYGYGFASNIGVKKIDPPHWWVGMKDTTLQLQVYGSNIRNAIPEINYVGIRIDSVVRLDGSPDYQYVYLSIGKNTKPGKVQIKWCEGKHTIKKEFDLRPRLNKTKGAAGFDASDVLYMVMPDRFANGDSSNDKVNTMNFPVGANRNNLNLRHGGDIKGIYNHIGYLDSLGITTLWLNPVLENDMPGGSYHGYATTDYYRVDPRFGSNDDYIMLIDSLHAHGIKTVMDMIFNHCGSAHQWFINKPSTDWFNFNDGYVQTNYRLSTITDPYSTEYDKKLSTDGWFVEAMPDLNQRNKHLMKYLTQNSIWWIEESGIDGIRMDTYPYADRHAMAEWITAVENEYPDFKILGECWFADPAGEAYWQKGSPLAKESEDTNLPVIMDFALMMKNREMVPFKEHTDAWNGLNKIYDHLALDYIYPNPLNVLRFLDNHDTERFILEVPDSLDQWKQAITMLLTIPGIPQIYYGTELLMSGDRKLGDGNVRRDMPGGFPGDTINAFTATGRTTLQNEAFDFMTQLLKWRKANPNLMKGKMRHFMPTNGLYVYERSDTNDNRAIIIMNGTDDELEVDMTRYKEFVNTDEELTDVLSKEKVVLLPKNNKKKFKPREIMILQ